MFVLIAESKAMSERQQAVSAAARAVHVPVFEGEAAEIIGRLRGLDNSVLAGDFKLGPQNVARLRRSIDEFTDKSAGLRAIDAFTGVVFRALDAASLDDAALQRGVGIVSSLYGLLRTDDVIKPYRLDYLMKAAPDGRSLAAWWKPRVTEALANVIREHGHSEVLNLLPADAAKCIDWKLIGGVASVYTAEFKQYGSGGSLKRPSSEYLKRLRGTLLRHIIVEGISSAEELRKNAPEEMMLGGEPSGSVMEFIVC